MNVAQHYQDLCQHSAGVLDEALSDIESRVAFTSAHNYIIDYDKLKLAIKSRPEVEVLEAAVKEYQFALFALSIGQYRHAFGGLRLFFEHMLVTIQFSAHEIDFRLWSKDSKDINWSSLKDPNTGIFATNFIKAFNPDFSEHGKQFSAIAETVYRECSEYVHGNASTHNRLPTNISFNKEMLAAWHQKAEAMRLVIIFAFSARYLRYIQPDEQAILEPVVLEIIGHLPAVQAIFSKPADK